MNIWEDYIEESGGEYVVVALGQAFHDLNFSQKLRETVVGSKPIVDTLDGDGLLGLAVDGLVDRAKASGSYLLAKLVF